MRDPIATALRTAKGYGQRYAEGGDVDPEALAFEPGESWTPPPEPLEAGYPEPQAPAPNKIRENAAALARYSRGSPPPTPAPQSGQSLTQYNPTAAENIGAAIAGEHGERRHLAEGLVGQAGLGTTGGLLGWTPLGQALQFQEAGQHGNAQEAALAIMPGAKGASGVAKTVAKGIHDLHPSQVHGWLEEPNSQLGSNPGSMYHDPAGKAWYIKTPSNPDPALTEARAKNEKLASELYKLSGTPAADVHLTEVGGQTAVASPIIPGKTLNKHGPDQYGDIEHLQGGFPTDVWLANYDSVGTGKDNIVINNNVAHRIDMGGALQYRAQGKLKNDFGPDVNEFKTMTQGDLKGNYDAAQVFGGKLTPEVRAAQKATAQRIVDIPSSTISDLVDKYGPKNADERAQLKSTIFQRRQQVAEHYGVKPSDMPGTMPNELDQLESYYKQHRQETATPDPDDIQWIKNQYKEGNITEAEYLNAIHDGEPPPHDYNPNLIKDSDYQKIQAEKNKPIGVMQLNKTHNLDQLVDTLKPYHYDEISTKKITEKQKDKISQLLDKTSISKLAEKMEDLDKQEAINLKSWLTPEKKALLNTKQQLAPTPMSIDKLNVNHSPKQIVGLLKDKSLYDSNITYGQAEHGKKIINSLPPEKLFETIKDLPLSESDKIKSWLSLPMKQKLSNLQHGYVKKSQEKSMTEKFDDFFKSTDPFHFKDYKTPEDITNPDELKYHPQLAQTKRQEFKNKEFNPDVPIFHGGMEQYPAELHDPKVYKNSEKAFFGSHYFANARSYAGTSKSVRTFFARSPKAYELDWHDLTGANYYSGSHMHKLIDVAHKHNADLVIVHNMDDQEGLKQTQYLFLKTEHLRAPHAELAKEHLNKSWPLAGLVGGSLYTLKGQEPEQEHYAKGGAVKVAKASVNYSKGMEKSHCGICQFYQDKTCSKVQGPIDWSMWCKLYKAKE